MKMRMRTSNLVYTVSQNSPIEHSDTVTPSCYPLKFFWVNPGSPPVKRSGRKFTYLEQARLRHTVTPENGPYMITHFDFCFFSCIRGTGVPCSIPRDSRSKRIRFMKRVSTFSAVLADVSINLHPYFSANAEPSSLETSRWWVRSHLFPTRMKIGSPRLTLCIDRWKIWTFSDVDREATEYTSTKPCPSLNKIRSMSEL